MTASLTATRSRQNPYSFMGVDAIGTTDAHDLLVKAGLNWTVEVVENQAVRGGVAQTHKDKRSTIKVQPNGTDWSPLGVVGNIWHPFQNLETADLLQAVADDSNAIFNAAGELRGGRSTFVQMLLSDEILIGGRDAMRGSFVIFNGNVGNERLRLVPTLERLACKNQFPALKGSEVMFSARHTEKSLNFSIEEVREAVQLSFASIQETVEIGNQLVTMPMNVAEFEAFAAQVHTPGIRKATGLETEASKARTLQLKQIFTGAENLEGVRGTRWAALQAIIEQADWGTNTRASHQSRIVSRVDDALKARAVQLLLPA